MLKYLILKFRVAKVQAELMAQVKNQLYVNAICQKPNSIELIDLLYRKAYYRRRKDAAFLIVCALMVMIINDSGSTKEEKEFCYHVLKDRCLKMQGDTQYRMANFMVFGDCEEALASWEIAKTRE